ncbi:glycosyltransferase family 32 protein [Phocaeicola plebeius]|jgi:mannosyltransferase OCH1-like enzyme|uniref:Glycosyl transferase n=1 Tax=Phocaeicola plebeius TaxID=310297 RepID=A0A414FW45_9BACT|nr:glycosyltransferase [Phocaeicola plebeius]RHD55446.1 glycosyl transferase [Phocaeicola plebeius]
MIPKIIHYCWLSGDPYPEDIKKCIQSWKRILPDYEFWLWDTNRFNIESTLWTKQAFETKKYAFAADYIRLYALYNYGGIYLDSDVLMYKSFNDLLDLPYFIGTDQDGAFEPAIIGSEKNNDWLKDVLKRYENLNFIITDNNYNTTPLPMVFFKELTGKYKFKKIQSKKDFLHKQNYISVFESDFFNARNSIEVHPTDRSYCAHNYAGSWKGKEKGIKKFIKDLIPKFLLKIYFDISHNTWNKKRILIHKIKFEK